MVNNRLRVRQVWTGWADEIASRVVYGTFGRSRRRVKHRAAHRFLRTRSRWNQYVSKALRNEQITSFRAKQMCGCRYQGAKLTIEMPKYACHDGLCPYCYYRWMTSFLKKNSSWARSDRLDVAVIVREVKEGTLVDPDRFRASVVHCRDLRRRLLSDVRRQSCEGASVVRLWAYVEQKRIVYRQRVVVVGRGLDRRIEETEGIHGLFDIPARDAWRSLQYCKGWLEIPYELGRLVVEWNQSFRARSFSDRE